MSDIQFFLSTKQLNNLVKILMTSFLTLCCFAAAWEIVLWTAKLHLTLL